MAAVASTNRSAATVLFNCGADPYRENDEGTTIVDFAWNNNLMRNWAIQLGVGEGKGVSGKCRLSVYKLSEAFYIAAKSQQVF